MVSKVIIKVNTEAKENSVTILSKSKSGKVTKGKINKVANRKIAMKGTKATMKRKVCSKRNNRAKRSAVSNKTMPRNSGTPTRKSGTPTLRAATPTRKSGTPTRRPATPTRKSGTPTRKSGTPTRKSGTPTRRSATPTRKSGTPTRRPATSTRKSSTPTRKSGTPTRKSGTPTRKSVMPTRRIGSKKRCTSKTCSNASSIASTKELVSLPSVGPAFAKKFRELGVCNTQALRRIAKCTSRYVFSKWLRTEVCANCQQVRQLTKYFKLDFAVKSAKTEVKIEKKDGEQKSDEKTEASPATAGDSL